MRSAGLEGGGYFSTTFPPLALYRPTAHADGEIVQSHHRVTQSETTALYLSQDQDETEQDRGSVGQETYLHTEGKEYSGSSDASEVEDQEGRESPMPLSISEPHTFFLYSLV